MPDYGHPRQIASLVNSVYAFSERRKRAAEVELRRAGLHRLTANPRLREELCLARAVMVRGSVTICNKISGMVTALFRYHVPKPLSSERGGMMRTIKAILVLAALASAVLSAPVLARGGHGHHFRGHHHNHSHHRHHRHSHARFGLFIGAPLALAPWYVGPRYYYPPAVVVPSSPPVYIERGQAAALSDEYWYYCRESATYYPYVKECAGPWQKVVPHAPPS